MTSSMQEVLAALAWLALVLAIAASPLPAWGKWLAGAAALLGVFSAAGQLPPW